MIRCRALLRDGVGLIGSALVLGVLALPLAWPAEAAAAVAPRGWAAHSAYGLQISIPRSWTVASFQDCPRGRSGTLLIGAPLPLTNCAEYSAKTNLVAIQPTKSQPVAKEAARHLWVHGLAVMSQAAGGAFTWVLPSEHVMITAQGPEAVAVLRTVARATAQAKPATGRLTGQEQVVALSVAPVTGPISVDRLGPRRTNERVVHAFDGSFSSLLPPGRYRLSGQSGNVDCPSVVATVRSGRTAVAPTIDCQGS